MNISEILAKFRAMSPTTREQGKLFEKFVKQFLLHGKLYPNIRRVWTWTEFPYKISATDIGIDLVVQFHSGEYWAIQCKFYEEGTQIAKADIDSFLSASSTSFMDADGIRQTYSYRLVVATVDVSSNALQTLEKQVVQAGLLQTSDFDVAGIDWQAFWDEFDSQVIQEKSEELSANVLDAPKQLRPYQQAAIDNVLKGFQTHDRGKLLMACGTGKTYTSLKIVEAMTTVPELNPKTILYLVPSLSLLAQTLRAWTVDAQNPIRPLIVCSDHEIHEQDSRRKKALKEDIQTGSTAELAQPATTNPTELATRFYRWESEASKENASAPVTIVFSTYQSIQVISDAQQLDDKQHKPLPAFDLIICDEAHRTTGVTLSNADESAFVKVHDNAYIRGKKRLYMTATPRIYGDAAKKTAKEKDSMAVICSMDDESLYGPVFHRLGFGEAVDKNLLTDYRVIVLAIDEEYTRRMTCALSLGISDADARSEDSEIQIDDISKILGCWAGLCKRSQYVLPDGTLTNDFSFDPAPMKRAVAFCSTIKNSRDLITPAFESIVNKAAQSEKTVGALGVEVKHIDGTFGANERKELLDWLKEEPAPNTCRILSNVRCLSEGVDVPSLDAVLFLSPRNSQVDVIQSLGRVMRKAPGKKYGYIILPVAIPADKRADEVLDDNKRYKVVWEVLRALRAHDERFNVWINQLQFNEKTKQEDNKGLFGRPDNLPSDDGGTEHHNPDEQLKFDMEFQDAQKNIIARVVKKCGKRDYLEEWAKEIAIIAAGQIGQIKDKLLHPTEKQKAAFDEFLSMLQTEINPSISEPQAIEMLSQHFVTKPVFDALFSNYSFVKNNVVSKAIQKVLDVFEPQETEEEKHRLADFHREIRYKVEGITSTHGKQQVINNLYDQFFRQAFPKVAQKLGIVYTPIEIVDFIIQSVEYILKKTFRRRLSNPTVHILDPFTGTGTFLVRLIQSGLIDKKDFRRKFTSELHANEIVLLAYYIAAINIEEAIHAELCRTDSRYNPNDENSEKLFGYEPFPGIVLTDTFHMNERPLPSEPNLFGEDNPNAENRVRIVKQRQKNIEVIISNPPYSVGQDSANDNNQNQKYPLLDKRVEETYVAASDSTNKNSLYDSYIKAFRWASDRIGNSGVIGFVTNSGWIDGNATSGFRKCLAKEFTSIYVFNLRGAIRGRSGENAKKEGQNVFNILTGVAITILIKNPADANKPCQINYYDVGDYLKQSEKLSSLNRFMNIENVPWTEITPNEHGDWINQRDDEFTAFNILGAKNGEREKPENFVTFFEPVFSRGIATARDAWAYNYSQTELEKNMSRMIDYYNLQLDGYRKALKADSDLTPEQFLSMDSTKISWNRGLLNDVRKLTKLDYNPKQIRLSLYRPYCRQMLYLDRHFNDMIYQIPLLFPTADSKNQVICLESPGTPRDFSCIITDSVPDLHCLATAQCFPLYYYEPIEDSTLTQDDVICNGYVRRDGITDAIYQQALDKYRTSLEASQTQLTKEDIFYYVYGILHSPTYREKYASDLKKSLARLPLVNNYDDFVTYSKAGRKLAALHLNYDNPKKLSAVLREISSDVTMPFTTVPTKIVNLNVHEKDKSVLYNVHKMRFSKPGKEVDKSKIDYNAYISIEGIPLDTYKYIVNGKSAIEWIMDRYAVKTDKDNGIVNNPNQWNDGKTPDYIVKLIQSVVTVSVNTMRIVHSLPKWEE